MMMGFLQIPPINLFTNYGPPVVTLNVLCWETEPKPTWLRSRPLDHAMQSTCVLVCVSVNVYVYDREQYLIVSPVNVCLKSWTFSQ